jgi:hypothetical protein
MYKAEGLRVLCDGRMVCTAVSDEMARVIATALNYADKTAEEAERRARFYTQNPY